MNKDELYNLVLDMLAGINRERVNNNLSKDRLIFNSGQREALTTLLELIDTKNGNDSN
jgi:hypothetical protein